MSAFSFRTFLRTKDPLERAAIQTEWKLVAASTANDQLVFLDTPQFAGVVLHHGNLRSPGIASDRESRYHLVIAGGYWLHDSDCSLATPSDALNLIAGTKLPDGQSLKGNYSFVLADGKTGEIVAECDPFGVVPLYYAAGKDGLVVGSNLKFLCSAIRPRLCREAVEEYLSIGYLVSELTLLDGVRRLQPGSRLYSDGEAVRVLRFALPSFPRNCVPDDDFLEEMGQLFERAITRYGSDTRSFSVSLSGGVDSRTALEAAAKLGFEVRAWSAGDPGSLECRVAQEYCSKRHVPIRVHTNRADRLPSWFDQFVWATEARSPPGHIHFADALFGGTADRVVPQLHGLIGDAVAGGDLDIDSDVPSRKSELSDFCRSRMQSILYWPGNLRDDISLGRRAATARVLDRIGSSILSRCPADDPYSAFLWSRYQFRVFGFTVPCLVSQVTPWTDIVTPFLDPAFFDQCARIATSSIVERQAQFRWAVRGYPTLTDAPRVKDGVLVPFSDHYSGDYSGGLRKLERLRAFRYFVCRLSFGRVNMLHPETYPFYGRWYRTCSSIREFFEQRLLSEESLDRGLWRREGIVRLMHDLRIGRNVWDSLATIMLLETFARLFVDQTLQGSPSLATEETSASK